MPKTKRNWKKEFTTVTTVSKIIALILFISLPFIGFYFGVQFERNNPGIFDLITRP